MNSDSSGQAFGFGYTERKDGFEYPRHEKGMSLRDYFAGQALASLDWGSIMTAAKASASPHEAIAAAYCYELADAMLKAREE